MLPQSLLPQLTPAAAKLYLALLTLQPPNSPLIHAPLKTLCPLTNLSDKSCRRALHQLRTLNLLTALPREYHRPGTYILIDASPHRSPMTAPPTPKPVTHDRTPSPSSHSTPAGAAKNPNRSPVTALLNPSHPIQNDRTLITKTAGTATVTERPSPIPSTGTHPAQAAPDPSLSSNLPSDPELDILLHPTFLKLMMELLPPAQTAELIANAQSTLARLDAQEAHP